MQKHTGTYLKHFCYGPEDFIPCTICSRKARDIHHIHAKKMGGHKTFDMNGKTHPIESIKNLIALCRECHNKAHDNNLDIGILWIAQQTKLIKHG